MNVDLVNLIGSLGFPIVACCAMFVQQNKNNQRHEEEVDKLADIIKDNTASINNLAELIKGGLRK